MSCVVRRVYVSVMRCVCVTVMRCVYVSVICCVLRHELRLRLHFVSLQVRYTLQGSRVASRAESRDVSVVWALRELKCGTAHPV